MQPDLPSRPKFPRRGRRRDGERDVERPGEGQPVERSSSAIRSDAFAGGVLGVSSAS